MSMPVRERYQVLRAGFLRQADQRIGDLFLAAVVRRTNNFGNVTWLGNPVWQNVLDLWALQEAFTQIRPALVLETGTNQGGSAMFYASLYDLLGCEGRVVTVDVEPMHSLHHPRVQFEIGSSVGDEVLAKMRAAADHADGPVMVVLDSDHSRDHVAAELEHYSGFVTPGSLMLVQDTVIDSNVIFRADRPGPLPAVESFLSRHSEFYVDPEWDRRFVASHHPKGWLRKR